MDTWRLQPHFKVRFAGGTFVDTPNLLVYKDAPILSLRRRDADGTLEIDIEIFDARGRPVGKVRSGVLADTSETVLELNRSENQFAVKEPETGRTLCEIRRRGSAKEADLDVFVQLYMPDGFLVHANPAQSNISSRSKKTDTIAKTSDAALRYR